jgi:putative protein-disulfide isomerase
VVAETEQVAWVVGFDPLCGWCYGFRPSLRALRKRYAGRATFTIRVGGLVTGGRVGPLAEAATYMADQIPIVEALSGVKFGAPFLGGMMAEGTWVADSEPPCRALRIVRELAPAKHVDFAEALSLALYRDGRPIDEEGVIADAAAKVRVDASALLERWHDPEEREATLREFTASRNEGITNYPSLFLMRHDRMVRVISGYAPADEALARAEAALG